MRSFKEFFTEANGVRLPFPGTTQYTGDFGLPDLRNFYTPGEAPPGGYQNFSQFAQSMADKDRYSGRDEYVLRDTLEKFRALVENVWSAVSLRQQNPASQNQKGYEQDYQHAYYDEPNEMLRGLPKHEIIGGHHPRLRNDEVGIGYKLGIVVLDKDNADKGWYAIDVRRLREEMHKLHQVLQRQERGYRAWGHIAGKVDQAFGTAMQGGRVPDTTGTKQI